jgi:hypothetical protein
MAFEHLAVAVFAHLDQQLVAVEVEPLILLSLHVVFDPTPSKPRLFFALLLLLHFPVYPFA